MRPDRPSATALFVALGVLTLSRRRSGRSLVHPADAAILRGVLRALGRLPALLSVDGPLDFVALAERLLAPGLITHFGLRKRLIQDAVLRAVGEGATQVVVVGAGLDTLTLDLARDGRAARLVEIDHPATQHAKQSMLRIAGIPPSRIILAPADLARTSVSAALARVPEFDPARPTVFIAEGLSMYLDEDQVSGLLADLASAAPHARLLMTFMPRDARGRIRFTSQSLLLRLALRICGAPFRWGIQPASLGAFMSEKGWRLSRVHGPEEFAVVAEHAALRTIPKFVGEYVAEATTRDRT